MFALGTVFFGAYKVWITTPVFTIHPLDCGADKLPYYEVMVTRIGNMHYYVNPVKELLKLDLTDRNPLHKPKDKESLTLVEREFHVEHQSYMSRKEMVMPLWKLSRRHVEELFDILWG
jgi:hypothetical protein